MDTNTQHKQETASEHLKQGHRKGFCPGCKGPSWMIVKKSSNGFKIWCCTKCKWQLL